MNKLEQFAKGIDEFVKANKDIQPEDTGLLAIRYEFLIDLFIAVEKISEEENKMLQKKLKVIKDVLDL